AQFPFAKWTQWDGGIKFGMIACWPGKIKANSTTEALVQYEDFVPTLVDAAGGAPIPGIDGRSFLNVLLGKTDEHRQYAFGAHSNRPKGPPYPIRSIRNKKYKLIHNLRPDSTFYQKYLMGYDITWKSWVERAKTDEYAAWVVKRFEKRPECPEFQFYDVENDPFEINDIADDPKYANIIKEMRIELEAWMKSQGDTGVDTD
ncbi:MAG: heparan N-sulfatase, partial [FCB group bacterium]|nr:heparan N-sulfatase [FCB group bacterium]